jgi:nucleoid DNA-binding protein
MSETYSRKNAVAFLVKNFDLSKSQADKLLLDLFGDLAKALKKGQRVQLNPFGSFNAESLVMRSIAVRMS